MEQLNKLDEIRQDVIHKTNIVQQQISRWHDNFIKDRKFHLGDWALLFYSKLQYFKEKFKLIDLVLMILKLSLIMEQLELRPLMKKK